jgi:regulator of protease activity HflC (stomatin/prohibitin superfamily)
MPDKVPSAFYKLTDHVSQIRSYVFDVVRSSIPRLELDEAFASKDDVANNVKNQLSALMAEYGYEILAALVIDLDPNAHVKAAMNDINASQRLREAAAEKAEAEKILQVKSAEADAESKYLSGLGVAKQRKAIVDGLRETVHTFSEQVNGAGPKDVMDLLLMTQYFDMIRDLSHKRGNNTLFLPHGPRAVEQLRADLAGTFTLGSGATPPGVAHSGNNNALDNSAKRF